jgi:hypothetical protein
VAGCLQGMGCINGGRVGVAPDIAAVLKINSCLRSRHLVLWSLGTLTGQHRFYGSRLVTQKGRYYHPLNVLSKTNCIAVFVLNC